MGTILYKPFYLLHVDKEVKKVFPVAPIGSFKSAWKLYPLQGPVGSFKCNKSRCQVCMNVNETETFTSTATGESFKINHKFNCDDKGLIYLNLSSLKKINEFWKFQIFKNITIFCNISGGCV